MITDIKQRKSFSIAWQGKENANSECRIDILWIPLHLHSACELLWTELLSSQNAYVEALTPNNYIWR